MLERFRLIKIEYKAVLASYNGHLRFGNCSSLIFENLKNIIKILLY